MSALRVVTAASWLARELAASGQDVVTDLGLVLPEVAAGDAWWCSGTYAMRLAVSGVDPLFRTMGGSSLARLPKTVTKRQVRSARLSTLVREELGAVFAKPADTKVPGLPARVYDTAAYFADAALAAGLGLDSPVLVSDVLRMHHEYRAFVVDRQVLTISPYLVDGQTWDAMDPAALPPTGQALEFAREAALHLPLGACAIDVAHSDLGWVVVEVNPSWCANPYWSSLTQPDAVVRAIRAGQGPQAHGALWRGDPSLRSRVHPIRAGLRLLG